MKKSIELPISEPVYSTYHYQGNGGVVLKDNPSVRNWYLNQGIILRCNRHFLYGSTSPEICVNGSSYWENPYLDKIWLPMKYLGRSIHSVIRALLDDGYYVVFGGVDDYYVKGKSWYHERHFNHDGLICGYDQDDKTYSIYAYDQSWVYRVFKTHQKCFEEGRKAEFRKGNYGVNCGIKVKPDIVELKPKEICSKLREYLDSSLDKYPLYINKTVYGTAVHDYIAMYLNKLADGSIPYEQMDRRVFRMLWEHKKVMLERIAAVEDTLQMDQECSARYEGLVKEADHMRMLYASHHIKRRDSVLPVIRDKLIALKKSEVKLLTEFVEKTEGELNT